LLFGNGNQTGAQKCLESTPGERAEDESSESFRAATKAIGKSQAKNDKPVNKLAKALRKNDPTMDRRPKFKD
jgi:hypothetical protein